MSEEKRSEQKPTLDFYQKVKRNCNPEEYLEKSRHLRRPMAILRMGLWRWQSRILSCERKSLRCPACVREESEEHILVKCEEYEEYRKKYLPASCKKWGMNELVKATQRQDSYLLLYLKSVWEKRENILQQNEEGHDLEQGPPTS